MAQRFLNPVPQFFYTGTPAAPLTGGLVYFYEPGTDTPKDTYSDNGLTTANTNPVVLTSSGMLPNVFLDGSYKVVLTDKDGVQQPGWPRDPVNSIVDIAFSAWNSTINYGLGAQNIVYASDGNYYVSLQDNNLGNDPVSSPAHWELFLTNVGGASIGTNNFTGAQNFARVTVASDTTPDIWGVNGNQINYTGIATATGFANAPQAGASRTLICAGASAFTAGANMLIDGVSSGNTVTCAANDQVIVQAVSTTQFKLSRIKYDGTPQVSGAGLDLIAVINASAAATVDFDPLSTSYDKLMITAENVTVDVDTYISCRVKIAGAFVSTNTYYSHLMEPTSNAATYAGVVKAGAADFQVSGDIDNTTGLASFTVEIHSPAGTARPKMINSYGASIDRNGYHVTFVGSGHNSGTGAVTGLRLFSDVGAVMTGTFRIYGYRNSL